MLNYERDVAHCSPTTYVKDVTVKAVLPAENSDSLERIFFQEIGWEAIAKEGQYHAGDSVFFIPPESVLPLELSEALGVTKYLGKGRVKCLKLRGNRSEGLIVDKAVAEPYLPHILQWEDPPQASMNGEKMLIAETPIYEFPEFYRIPNLLNEPDIFEIGEGVYFSEKIHGTNVRFGVHENPETGKQQLYVGSHKVVLKESENNLYWQVVRQHIEGLKLPPGVTFYSEIYGHGIQDLHYDTTNGLRVFATAECGRYHPVWETIQLCGLLGLKCVKFYPIPFYGVEQMRYFADSPSTLTDSHVREGIVIREAEWEFRAAKVLGTPYLTRGGKKTERH
jgi:RNA ligase (TIGR02306 family)